jgi:hypothetical protein
LPALSFEETVWTRSTKAASNLKHAGRRDGAARSLD